jgi:ribonuclease inhibitor
MEQIDLNLSDCQTREELHTRIRDALDFPAYYGMNLDALFDLLSTESRPTRLVIAYPAEPCDALRTYWPLLLRVFDNAALENDRLQIIFKEA